MISYEYLGALISFKVTGFHFQIDPDPKGTTLWIQIRNRNKNIQLGKYTFFRASRYETIALQREITPNVYFFI